MKLETVITNLRNTIAGKEMLLEACRKTIAHYDEMDDQCDGWLQATITAEVVAINIDELNRILDDLVECQVKGIELSWRDNPDRMGGQFTQDEIDNASAWR